MKIPMTAANIGAKAMTSLDPERAHRLTVKMMASGLAPRISQQTKSPPCLRINVAGIDFPNPLGLAAGFDKNAEVIGPMLRLGFGFVEVGGVTPRPQPGNPRPRVFRLREDHAVINRYGFNNDGVEVIARRLQHKRPGLAGVNLGANKDSEDRIADYLTGLERLDGLADFFAVNISSPNTPGLRALQDKASLDELLSRVMVARAKMTAKVPVFLKIAPDLTDEDKADIAASVTGCGLDGLIISNTTIARAPDLKGASATEAGGLSGAPLFAPSTALLKEFYGAIGKDMPLIGVGGVSSGEDAYKKILAGASLVQLYTAMIYKGPSLAAEILRSLVQLSKGDGFKTISEAVGAE